MSDEIPQDPGGIFQAAVCGKTCSVTSDCPTDTPPGATATPTCSAGICVLSCGESPPKCPEGWGTYPDCTPPKPLPDPSTPTGTKIATPVGKNIVYSTYFGLPSGNSSTNSKVDCSQLAGCMKSDCNACIQQYWSSNPAVSGHPIITHNHVTLFTCNKAVVKSYNRPFLHVHVHVQCRNAPPAVLIQHLILMKSLTS